MLEGKASIYKYMIVSDNSSRISREKYIPQIYKNLKAGETSTTSEQKKPFSRLLSIRAVSSPKDLPRKPLKNQEINQELNRKPDVEDMLEKIMLAQAVSTLRRWRTEAEHVDQRNLVSKLWDSSVVAGQASPYVTKMSMLSTERWTSFRTRKEKSQYINRSLSHRKISRVTPSMAKNKLCPKGKGKITVYSEVQAVAPKLMTPGGPIKRLILELPAGAGKTCTYLAVLADFIGWADNIVVVGEPDVFIAFQDGLRKCPARVFPNLKRPDGTTYPIPEDGAIYLREINDGTGAHAFCTLNSQNMDQSLQAKPYKCPPNSWVWLHTKVYFWTYVMAGNFLQRWSGVDSAGNHLPPNRGSKYYWINPWSERFLMIIDEVHNVATPYLLAISKNLRSSAALLSKYLPNFGKEAAIKRANNQPGGEEKNPYILGGTATPNITQFPTLSLCLPALVKGFNDLTLFNTVTTSIGNALGKKKIGNRHVDLHTYLDPKNKYVEIIEEFDAVAIPPYAQSSGDYEKKRLSVASVHKRLSKYRGYASEGKSAKLNVEDDFSQVCPISEKALQDASQKIYRPIEDSKGENRQKLLDIFWGVAYVVDMKNDFRYYPDVSLPYPYIRSVPVPKKIQSVSGDYLDFLEHSEGESRWTENSQFCARQELIKMVKEALLIKKLDVEKIEFFAPKWKAAAEDLLELKGRTMIYPGAYFRSDFDDNYYNILLALYLQAKLKILTKELYPNFPGHRIHTIDELTESNGMKVIEDYVNTLSDLSQKNIASSPPPLKETQGPSIYIMGDSCDGKYKPAELKKTISRGLSVAKTGNLPDPHDMSYMISVPEYRKRQFDMYNKEPCTTSESKYTISATCSIIIIAEGGHKALDLKCTSNGLILCALTGGKFAQTQGRIKRNCAWKEVDDTRYWVVTVRVYLLWFPNCLTSGPVIDFVLENYYREQFEIIRYLEMLQAMAGIGCSTWELYSEWRKTFSDMESKYAGGFRCAFDKTQSELHIKNKANRTFFYCDLGEDKGDEIIKYGLSGDVNPTCVTQSTKGMVKNLDKTAYQSVNDSFVKISNLLVNPRFVEPERLRT